MSGIGAHRASRRIGVTHETRWWRRKQYGGINRDRPKRLKALETEDQTRQWRGATMRAKRCSNRKDPGTSPGRDI